MLGLAGSAAAAALGLRLALLAPAGHGPAILFGGIAIGRGEPVTVRLRIPFVLATRRPLAWPADGPPIPNRGNVSISVRSQLNRARRGVAHPHKSARRMLRSARIIARLSRHPGFDHEWYALVSGHAGDRKSLIAHYVRTGARQGLSPHPLFDPKFYLAHGREKHEAPEVFAAYVSDQANFDRPTHTLFDIEAYLAQVPEARSYPGGPLEHYRHLGTQAGLRPNDWFDPEVHPAGLIAWLTDQARAWKRRNDLCTAPRRSADHDRLREQQFLSSLGSGATRGDGFEVLVSVILPVHNRRNATAATLRSVLAQTLSDWELLLVDDGSDPAEDPATLDEVRDSRIRVIRQDHSGPGRARNTGLARARGQYVAWLDSDDVWRPEHLRALTGLLVRDHRRAAYSIAEHRVPGEAPSYATLEGGREFLEVENHIAMSALVCERALLESLGGLDESLPSNGPYDLVLRVAAVTDVGFAPAATAVISDDRDDPLRISTSLPPTWAAVALNHQLIDWDALASKASRAPLDHVSVIIPTPNEWPMTTQAVRSITEAEAAQEAGPGIQVIVVDNGTDLRTAQVLASLAERFPRVEVIASPVNRGFALGNDIALPFVRGGTVVFLNNDTIVSPGWLEPLVSALGQPEVLGAQSLLVYPTGSVQSAGVAFPSRGGLPHSLLQGYPVEDARRLAGAALSALTGAALAMRFADVVRLRGFDPIFQNGMEDIDICLRAAEGRTGAFRLATGSVVVHLESRSPGRWERYIENRRLLLDRWDLMGLDSPRDDVRLWAKAELEVVRYEIASEKEAASGLAVPLPVIRARPSSVTEPFPRMRWALKNPAPSFRRAEKWGDTHFLRRLAEALEACNQVVVIDGYQEFYRNTGAVDEVVLVLRGLRPYTPRPGQVNLMWIISHPDDVSADECRPFDRVFAASMRWAAAKSGEWGLNIAPLLQCTDPALFHPDRAEPGTGEPALFVGGSRGRPRPIVTAAVEAGLPLRVFGGGWEGLIDPGHIAGQYVANEDLGAVYRAAGVVLNDHWEDMREQGFLSNRLFDAVASGARVVSDEAAGIEDVFGDAVQVISTPADLRRLVDARDEVFGPDERRIKAAAEVANAHTFDARSRELAAAAAQIRSTWGQAR